MGQLQITTPQNTAVQTPALPMDADYGRARTIAVPFTGRASTFVSDILKRIFSFPVMLASLLAGAEFCTLRSFRIDPDVWWHIKVGETILATHRFPTTDPYSFTVAGQPWLAYEWLGEVLLAAVNRIGGVVGLDILLIAIGSVIMIALYALATITCGNSKAGFVTAAILLLLAGVSFSLRPQMIGYFFLIVTLILLERFRQGHDKSIWLLPPLMLLWVNIHGSWVIGLGTIFVYWISGLLNFRVGNLEARPWTESDRSRIAFSFLLCLLMLPITPYGTRIAVSPFEYALSLPLNVKYIEEWQPMTFNLLSGKIFLVLLLGLFLAQVALGLTWRLRDLALYLAGTLMACVHVRFLLVFVPFFAPAMAVTLARWIPGYDRFKDKFLLNAALMACMAVAVIHFFPTRNDLERRVAEQFPVHAVEYMNQHPIPGPTFNNYGFGGYLVWSRGPEHKVFIDGRGDLYERGGVLEDYMHISDLKPGALDVLRGYGIQSCVIHRDEALATVLSASPDWRRVYFDKVSAIFLRTKQ
jgi:hypothetical protein